MKAGTVLHNFSAKDGRQVLLRTLKWEDLDDLLDLINALVDEEADITRSERVSLKQETEWLAGALARQEMGEVYYLVAVVDDKVVANSELRREGGHSKHVGVVGIAIKKGYRDVGIGSEMMKTLVDQARKLGLKMLGLNVFESNERAYHVYEKIGFAQTGVIPKKIYKDGKYINEIIMTKNLE